MTTTIKISAGNVRLLSSTLSGAQAQEILDGLGAVLTGRFQDAFREQRTPGGSPWPARMVPNVAGIVLDLNNDSTPKSRRFDARPAGRDTGKLVNSLTWKATSASVVIGSALPYASRVNNGGKSTLSLSGVGRRRLAIWLRSLPREERRELGLGWLFSKPTFEVNARKRTFVKLGPPERKIARDHVEAEVVRLTRGRV